MQSAEDTPPTPPWYRTPFEIWSDEGMETMRMGGADEEGQWMRVLEQVKGQIRMEIGDVVEHIWKYVAVW